MEKILLKRLKIYLCLLCEISIIIMWLLFNNSFFITLFYCVSFIQLRRVFKLKNKKLLLNKYVCISARLLLNIGSTTVYLNILNPL